MYDLTEFQRDVLWEIADLGEPKGLKIKSELEEYYSALSGEREEINHGRLYPNLDTLVNKGLVEKGEKDRRTNSYGLTDEGSEVLANRREWEESKLPADEENSSGSDAGPSETDETVHEEDVQEEAAVPAGGD